MKIRGSTARTPIVLAVIAIPLALGLLTRTLWFSASTSRWDTPDLMYCRERYRAARSRTDSAGVDGMVRPRAGVLGTTGLTCGVLRDGYPDFFWSNHKEPP